jgi:outer membrane receptor protein involved in Fe transport
MTLPDRIGRIALALALLLGARVDWARAQGVTTAGVQGVVLSSTNRQAISGARVELRSGETGQVFVTTTGSNGRFIFENITPGPDYTLTARAIGFRPQAVAGLTLTLNQRTSRELTLAPEVVQLEELQVVASEAPDPLINVNRTGAQQTVSDSAIQRLPLQGRNFADLIQTSPQVVGTSVAAQNNRFNNIQIDGGVNNDLFGLAATGVPGGQASARAISLEAVKEFQVLVAPYDVRQGNFAGGLVNGITKSGTNAWQGSLFAYRQAKNISGFRDDPTFTGLDIWQYGGTLGGPIVKDRVHFFTAIDLQQRDAAFSSPFNLTGDDAADLASTGFTTATAEEFADILGSQYGLTNVGGADAPSLAGPLKNIFGKLSVNAGESGLLEFSYNYADADRDVLIRNPTGVAIPGRLRDGWQLSNSGYTQSGKINTGRLRWLTEFEGGVSNELLLGYSVIRDNRALPEQAPLLLARVGAIGTLSSWLAAGAERFSQTNLLDQDIFSVADNLSFGTGRHRITVGTQNEFFNFRNDFFQASIGVWAFNSLDSLRQGLPSAFQRRIPNPTRGSRPIADIGASVFGLYAQDAWTPSPFLTLTFGLRADIPLIQAPPTNQALLNDPNLPINTGEFPNANVLWSPRLGFNWDVSKRLTSVVRGGVGVFSGRPPYVWLANSFTNTGADFVQVTCTSAASMPVFTVDPAAQPTSCANSTPSAVAGEVDYFDPDWKYPQNFRASLGLDQRLPGGLVLTLDGFYLKNVNNMYVQDRNLTQSPRVNGEGRLMYGTLNAGTGAATAERLTTAVSNAILHTNSSKGRTLSGTIQVQKAFSRFMELNVAYTYTDATDQMSNTSSQAFSNFQFSPLTGSIADRPVATAFFDVPHKITIAGTVNLPAGFQFSTIYLGRSGDPYTWITGGDPNADGTTLNDVPFIPADASQISLAPGSSFADLDAFISSQACLNEARGRLVERNTCRNPWQNFLNVRLAWVTPQFIGSGLELSLDIFNFLRFIGSDAGLYKEVTPFETTQSSFLTPVGYDAVNDRPIYRFTAPPVIERVVVGENAQGVNRSRWTMQLGAKYRFAFR